MEDSNFFRIRISSIHPSKPLPFDLYIYLNKRHTLYLHSGDQLSEEKRQKFSKSDSAVFFVSMEHKAAYKKFIHDQMTADGLDVKEKAQILRSSSMTLVEELYETPDVQEALKNSEELIGDFIDLMEGEPEAMAYLIGLSSHDFYTYNHSLDVSIYALGLGQALSFSNADLSELGIGSLLHDIGKRNVDVNIICKKGPLDEAEWAQMSKHPHYGLKILNEANASDAVKACCFEHHESFAGNGYPQQLEGDEIHPFARIIALCDTYDAMTTQRSYNKPMSPKTALDMMHGKLAKRYDPEMIKAMYSVLFKIQP